MTIFLAVEFFPFDVVRRKVAVNAIAAAMGRPGAARAVARANGANQLALVVPCHRVIGSDGALTGYGGGLWRKQRLLEMERKYL